MSDEASAPAGGEAIAVAASTPAVADTSELSINDAARALADARWKRNNPEAAKAAEAPAPEQDAAVEPEQELPDEGDADPETDPGEDTTEAEPAEQLPPIERPRSWTKDEDAEWQSLPRALQEKISAREQERDKGLRRSQNEAAEFRKAADAERKAAEEARKKYEEKLPQLERKLQTVGPFADIQTMQDLKNLQTNDPFRFQEYQLYVWEQQAEQQELREAESRKAQERQSKRAAYEAEQNKLLTELVPEISDPKKANELQKRAVAMLTDPEDIGITTETLTRWMQDDTGHEILSTAGIQKLIADGLKLREIKSAPLKAIPKPVPPVQKPGVARAPGSAASDKIQALTKQFNANPTVENATALRMARMSGQRRAS